MHVVSRKYWLGQTLPSLYGQVHLPRQRGGIVEIHAGYESNRYDGLQAYWTTNLSDLYRWQSIGHEIRKLVADRIVLGNA